MEKPTAEMPPGLKTPGLLWVGVGCQRFTSRRAIETAIEAVFQKHHLALEAIAGIATIDTKAREIGLVELCRDRQWPLRTFAAEKLRSQPVATPSATVAQVMATPSVAEAAALYAVATISPAGAKLLVPKQVFRPETEPGAVTIAVALAPLAYPVMANQNIQNIQKKHIY